MKRGLLPLGVFLLMLLAFPVSAARHVRVVLDLSRSMVTNDPGRLALLSTILLHDLARPNPGLGDSFEVIPFDHDWTWVPHGPPPVSTTPRIKAEQGKRDDFVSAIKALPYDARATYFYPGIAAALQDLKQAGGGAADVRAIVLVTDGVPLQPTRDEELQRIRDELGPQLEQNGIRLYVLAFGGEADRNRDFFKAMVRSPKGTQLGEFFVDPQGTKLLDYMLEIFSRSFGFSPDSAHPLQGNSTLDLDNNTTPEKVAVTVFSSNPQPPQLHLTPPSGGSVNDRKEVQSAGVRGGSYSLDWVLSPNRGGYGISSDAVSGSVAVLRPTRLVLEIEPAPPHKQAERALAGTRFPMRVIVRSPTGASGDPGPVDLSFRTLGERTYQPATGKSDYSWTDEAVAPPAGSGSPTAKGRAYEIMPLFREHPTAPTKPYAGYIEIESRRGEALVGSLKDAHAHRVEVHPLLSISPLPLSSYASSNALGRGEQACTQFAFHLNAGQLPHPDQPRYPLRVVLIASDPAVLDREFRKASFTLDGLPVEFEGKPSAQPGIWFKGRELAPGELLGNHNLCVRIGRPTFANPAQPQEVSLAATLLEDPYDDFKVVDPFSLKVLISAPTLLETWRAAVLTGSVLLLVTGVLWYSRNRPHFPSDLAYAVGREDSTGPLVQRELDERSGFAKLLGRIGDSPILAPGEDRVLARVRPSRANLFKVRTPRGTTVEAVGREETVQGRNNVATISVQRLYRLRSARGSYLLRMEYRR
jgi:hypothetical protein